MVTRRDGLLALAGFSVYGLAQAQAQTQQWPNKPVRVIVPYPPGGATDISARIYGQFLQQNLKQTFVLENKGGAGGEIGAAAAATSPPDGYTVLFGAIGSLAIHAVIPAQKPPYDLMTAFSGVSMGTAVQLAVAVRADLPVNSIKQLVALAKSDAKGLTYGSAGNGSTQHMTGEYFQQATGIKLSHVAYRGSGPAVADLLGGQIDMVFETLPALASQIGSGKLRLLAVTGRSRSDGLPDTPTMIEAGVPDFEVTTYYGALVPKGTPAAVIDALSQAMMAVSRMPQVQDTLKKQGALAYATTPAQTDELLRSEVAKWARVQKIAQIQ